MIKKRILFMGSGKFAVEVLKSLVLSADDGSDGSSEFEVIGVITQKDKPVGRKKIITPTLVRQFCLENSILNFQAENSAEILELVEVNNLECDFLVVADYGVILKRSVLDLPKEVSLNVHGSILPKYRGASPVHAALLNQDKEAGVSIITMTEKLDAGPVWLIESLLVEESDDYESLLVRLGILGGAAILKVLTNYSNLKPLDQNETEVSYAPKIAKEDGLIEWSELNLGQFMAKFKAYKLWPGIYFMYKEVKFEIIDFEVVDNFGLPIGQLLDFKGELYFMFEPEKGVKLTVFKPISKNQMSVSDFIRGNKGFFEKYED